MTNLEQAKTYARIRYRLFLVNTLVGLSFLFLFQFSGFAARLADFWQGKTDHPALLLLGFLLVFAAANYLVNLPVHLYRSYFLEKRFGLSRLTPKSWLIRELKHMLVGGLIGIGLFQGLYWILRETGPWWPLWATAGWMAVSVLLAKLLPTVILPIFYPMQPVENPSLVQRLHALCESAGVKLLGVFRLGLGTETRKANAALVGLGGTRRVLLSDTLLENFSDDEIEGVLAHELAHHYYKHIPKGLVLSVFGTLFGFFVIAWSAPLWTAQLGLSGLADAAGLPMVLLVLSLLNLLGMPLKHGVSRYFEWEADRFAVRRTPAAVFADALQKLAELNLADPEPPRWAELWLHDHPAIAKRIEAARAAAN